MSLLISLILLIYGRTLSDFDLYKIRSFYSFHTFFVESQSISCKFVGMKLKALIEQSDGDLHRDNFCYFLLV